MKASVNLVCREELISKLRAATEGNICSNKAVARSGDNHRLEFHPGDSLVNILLVWLTL